jgi:hypothetical protein
VAKTFDFDATLSEIVRGNAYSVSIEAYQGRSRKYKFTARLMCEQGFDEGSQIGDAWDCESLQEVLECMEKEAQKYDAEASSSGVKRG